MTTLVYAIGGRGMFVLQDFEVGEIIGYYFDKVKITTENLHLHLPSLYTFFDYDNEIYMDPYDPVTHSAFFLAAYANENIQNPEMNNTELVTCKEIYQYEEGGHE